MSGADQLVEFESNEISLNIPLKGITLDEGWKITPDIAPVVRKDHECGSYCYKILYIIMGPYMQVLKRHVDNFRPGQRIPNCQLSAVAYEDKKIPPLRYQVKLIGATKPYNMMAIELPSVSGTSEITQ